MDIKKIVASLIATAAINKNSRILTKIGGDKISYNAIWENGKIWYEVNVDIVEYVDKNVYRKTHNLYTLPYGKEPSIGISAWDALDMYKDYLTSSVSSYVNQNGKTIEWHENTEESVATK